MFLATIGIVANPPAFPAAGTVLSSSCGFANVTDAGGYQFLGYFEKSELRADGLGGSYSVTIGNGTSPCFYPAGYLYTNGPYSDLVATWWHNYDTGTVNYGSYNGSIVADGHGGTYVPGNSYTNQSPFVVHDYNGLEQTTSAPTHFVLWWGGENYNWGFYEVTYPQAGTFQFDTCADYYATDAWTGDQVLLHKQISYYSDGWGGSYSTDTNNTFACGYDPQGFTYSYDTNADSLTYYDQDGFLQTWQYHSGALGYRADGFGNSYLTMWSEWWATMGDVIASWYDSNTNYTVTLHYDGTNGYYTNYT
jgi:hypothetical protein